MLEGVPVRDFGKDACGAGALSSALTYLGRPTALEALDAELPKTKRGEVLSVDLLLASRRHGMDARWIEGSREKVEELLRSGLPALIMLQVVDAPGLSRDYYHYALIDGIDPDRELYRILFGDGRPRWVEMRRLERAWNGTDRALLLLRPAAQRERLRAAMAMEEDRALEAAAVYRALLEDRPLWTRVWINLGNALAAGGRAGDAEDAYRRALLLDPGSTDALNNLAWLLFERGRELEEAEILARRAACAQPPSAHAADTLAAILIAKGACDEAAALLTSILSGPRAPDERTGLAARLDEASRCSLGGDPSPASLERFCGG